jgi:hypothetical protein
MDEQSENDKIIYFDQEDQLDEEITIEIEANTLNEGEEVNNAFLVDKKWKSYDRKAHYMVLDASSKMIWNDGDRTETGTWEYVQHSNLLLLNFVQPNQIQHLIYQLILLDEEIMVIQANHRLDQENPYLIYYSCSRKPGKQRLKDMIQGAAYESEKSPSWGLLWILLILLLFVLYFVIIY